MKCPVCNKYFDKKYKVLQHMDSSHFNEIPEKMSAAKYYYALNHGGDTNGRCRVCSDPTEFDEATGLTKILCGKSKCKEASAKIARERSIKKFGVPHLLNNQDHQMKMLANRKISGVYDWSDGRGSVPYVGSYERRFLEFLDTFLSFDPATVFAPCPITIQYELDGEDHLHSPDYYIDIINAIVEIKHGGKNPNTHPKFQAVDIRKDQAKEKAIKDKTDYNYIKITDNDFGPFVKFLFEIIERKQTNNPKRLVVINESDMDVPINTQLLTEAGDPLDMWLHDMEIAGQKMMGTKDPDSMYLHFFGDVNKTMVGEIDIGITTKDNFDHMITFDIDSHTFKYVTAHDLKEMKPSFICTYKYIGELSLAKDMDELIEAVKTKKKYNVLTDLDAIVKVFDATFDTKKHYTLLDIAMNPDFLKYKTVRRNKGITGHADDTDLLLTLR